MKNNSKKIIYLSVISSLLIFLMLLGVVLFFFWLNKSAIFDNFAQSYLENRLTASPVVLPDSPALSQEWYVTNAVKKANPAVVSISIIKKVPVVDSSSDPGPFSDFWNFPLLLPQQYRVEEREVGGGTGFLASSDGYIITNEHVVSLDGAEYEVSTKDGEKYPVKVVARDPALDIAVLKIPGNSHPYLQFADSDRLQVGQSVIAIGNALAEFSNTVSVGIISGLARSVVAGDDYGRVETLDQVIQTDAAINPGNSGGPLLDLQGRVVGVNVAMVGGSQNINFALPSNSVEGVVESVRKSGKIVRPYLGIRYVVVDSKLKEKLNLPLDYGVWVSSVSETDESAVIPGSPAAKAGLKDGDVVLEIAGERIEVARSLSSLIRDRKVGDKVNLKIWRKGSILNIPVTLDELPERGR